MKSKDLLKLFAEALGVGLTVGVLTDVLLKLIADCSFKRKNKSKIEQIRNDLLKALKSKKITRTEYDLLYDLTTDNKINMAEYYFHQAVNLNIDTIIQ
jgi:hypothetical protein